MGTSTDHLIHPSFQLPVRKSVKHDRIDFAVQDTNYQRRLGQRECMGYHFRLVTGQGEAA